MEVAAAADQRVNAKILPVLKGPGRCRGTRMVREIARPSRRLQLPRMPCYNPPMRSYLRSRIGTVVLTIAVTMFMVVAGRNDSSVSYAQASATIWDSVYTEAQAARGKAVYADSCSQCHGDTPEGTPIAPALSGDDFFGHFKDKSVGDLFTKISTTMPKGEENSLKPAQVADLIAFLAMSNKWPAGAKELPPDPDALKQIQIVVQK